MELPFERNMEKIRREVVLKIIEDFDYKEFLEIGCGIDSIGNYLDFNEAKITVVEPDYYFLQTGTENLLNCTRFHGFFEEFPVGQKFDLIIISCLLHEIIDTKKFLSHLKRFCSRNTIIHINVPNSDSLHRLAAVEMGLLDSAINPTQTQSIMQQTKVAYNSQSLINEVCSAGFELVSSGGYFLKSNTHSQLSMMLDAGIITEEVLKAYTRLGQSMPEIAAEIYINIKSLD